MNAKTVIWEPDEVHVGLVPTEPPVFEDDLVLESFEDMAAVDESKDSFPHSLEEYCDYSRRIARLYGPRPIYIGYCMLPEKPFGVCY